MTLYPLRMQKSHRLDAEARFRGDTGGLENVEVVVIILKEERDLAASAGAVAETWEDASIGQTVDLSAVSGSDIREWVDVGGWDILVVDSGFGASLLDNNVVHKESGQVAVEINSLRERNRSSDGEWGAETGDDGAAVPSSAGTVETTDEIWIRAVDQTSRNAVLDTGVGDSVFGEEEVRPCGVDLTGR